MDQHDSGTLAAQLHGQLQRELTRALAATSDSPGLDRYVEWLRAAVDRLTGNTAADEARAVRDEWFSTRPRSARRATNAGPHVHV